MHHFVRSSDINPAIAFPDNSKGSRSLAIATSLLRYGRPTYKSVQQTTFC